MCVDGTHIKIFKPSEDNHLFYNRKGFYSLNAMIICDHKMRIRYVSAKHPGTCHDSYVWNNSDAATFFETAYRNGDNSRLLGDAGYPLQPWLLTPCRSTEEGTAQSRFNKALSKGRSQIERTIGVLKNRFRCLLGARQLHYAPEKAVMIANVCCALHNICLHYNTGTECVEFEDFAEEEETDDSEDSFTRQQDSRNNEANVIRETILASF